MNELPNLAGVATADLVDKIGGSGFQASYINWSRTMQLLREHAPGWLPVLAKTPEGGVVWRAPVGAYLMLQFEHHSGSLLPAVPQAIMDSRNNAIPYEKITARDITDTHRRGLCMAAALTFGLAYELWARIALESGYSDQSGNSDEPSTPVPAHTADPRDGVLESLSAEEKRTVGDITEVVKEYAELKDFVGAVEYLSSCSLGVEMKTAVWSGLSSSERSAIKKAQKETA